MFGGCTPDGKTAPSNGSGGGGGGNPDAGAAGDATSQMAVDAAANDAGHVDAGNGSMDASQVDAGQSQMCDDPFEGGQFIDSVSFVGEGNSPMDTAFNSGLDGRLYTDLSTLDENNLITPNENFYIRTRYPDRLDPNRAWNVRVHGLVGSEVNFSLAQIQAMVRPMGPVLLECSGNGDFAKFGMLSTAEWTGVPVTEVLAQVNILPSATRVLITGFDDHSQPSSRSTAGAAWVFTFDELSQFGGFFATEMNGVPLPRDHGRPLRLIMPRWFGCTCIKWVEDVELVDNDVRATSQMTEFASRTHQTRAHAFARDYRSASMQQAAMPIRIEQWRVNGDITYRVVGIMWGGNRPTSDLQVRFGRTGAYQDVTVCPDQTMNNAWTLWSHQWTPASAGTYEIHCRIDDNSVPTNRLDSGFYDRTVTIRQV